MEMKTCQHLLFFLFCFSRHKSQIENVIDQKEQHLFGQNPQYDFDLALGVLGPDREYFALFCSAVNPQRYVLKVYKRKNQNTGNCHGTTTQYSTCNMQVQNKLYWKVDLALSKVQKHLELRGSSSFWMSVNVHHPNLPYLFRNRVQ